MRVTQQLEGMKKETINYDQAEGFSVGTTKAAAIASRGLKGTQEQAKKWQRDSSKAKEREVTGERTFSAVGSTKGGLESWTKNGATTSDSP